MTLGCVVGCWVLEEWDVWESVDDDDVDVGSVNMGSISPRWPTDPEGVG